MSQPSFIRQSLNRIYRHFDAVPAAVHLDNYRFYMVLNLAQTMAWITHALWMLVFFSLGIYLIAYIQLVSVAIYILSIALNRRARHMLSMTLSLAELVFHQVLVSRLIGWDAGFQYFIPVAAIFPFLIPRANLVWKWALVLFAVLGYLYIELFIRKSTPVFALDSGGLFVFNVLNITLAFGFFTTWAYYFTVSEARSQTIIRQQARDLADAEHAIEQAKIEERLKMQEHENMLITREKERYQELLLNILPYEVARELKDTGKSEARMYHNVTVMFTDFKDFTRISERLTAEEVVHEIDICFRAFDDIAGKYAIEKIKTIGDSYMAVCGLPVPNDRHADIMVAAALEIRAFMQQHNERQRAQGKIVFETRIGIHSGPVVAGIIGVKKFAYDIWGDTVNIASRMESSCKEGEVNISGSTYELVKDSYPCSYRGKVMAKNKGAIDMYFVNGPGPAAATERQG
ncbi:MAG: hypothetical protein JNL72_04055 [Flavipsychrobacter sp.]|nr:hypothetical protein [Flavipsychrobacter sp.]